MLQNPEHASFPRINRGYDATFRPNRLSVGLVLPLEAYALGHDPTMQGHIKVAQLAEDLGFSALWLRDVPFNVPSFGDVGQIFDPFVYLGTLAVATRSIALGTASVILPLRHPAHVAKAAATADVLSDGRILLGVASGDRPEEYPALGCSYADRGAQFRDSFDYIRASAGSFPRHQSNQGHLQGNIDLLPKPVGERLPLLITGGSQQTPDWAAKNGDGWMTYPRDPTLQDRVVTDFRQRLVAMGQPNKPVMQSLYVDLLDTHDARPRPIHLGFQTGINFLRGYLREVEALGINHVALNLRFNRAPIENTLRKLSDDLLPDFH